MTPIDEFEKNFDVWYMEKQKPLDDEMLRAICFGAYSYGGDYWIYNYYGHIEDDGMLPETWPEAKKKMVEDDCYPNIIGDGSGQSKLLSILYDVYRDETKTSKDYAEELLDLVLEATEHGAFYGWNVALNFYREYHKHDE